jgi:hypothetical protein
LGYSYNNTTQIKNHPIGHFTQSGHPDRLLQVFFGGSKLFLVVTMKFLGLLSLPSEFSTEIELPWCTKIDRPVSQKLQKGTKYIMQITTSVYSISTLCIFGKLVVVFGLLKKLLLHLHLALYIILDWNPRNCYVSE